MSPPTLRGIVTSPDWMYDAACRQSDPEIFYPDTGHGSRDARAVCTGCPVRAECLAYALEHREHHGVWGGLSERQRRHLRETGGRSVNRTGSDARQNQGRTEAVRKLAETLSDSEIAAQLGCPRRTVMRVRRLAGIPPAHPRYGGIGHSASATRAKTSGRRVTEVDETGNLLAYITQGGTRGRTRTEISTGYFKRNRKADAVTAMLGSLIKDARVRLVTEKSPDVGCRPTTRYLATSHDRARVAS